MRKLTDTMIAGLVMLARVAGHGLDYDSITLRAVTRAALIRRGLVEMNLLASEGIEVPRLTDAGAEWLRVNRYVAWSDQDNRMVSHVADAPMTEIEQTAWVDLANGRAAERAVALREINRIAGHQDWSPMSVRMAHTIALRLNGTPVPSAVQAAPPKDSPTLPVFRAEWELIINRANEGREVREEPEDVQVLFAVADGGDVVLYNVFTGLVELDSEGLPLTMPMSGLSLPDRNLIADAVEALNHSWGCCAPLTSVTTYATLGVADASDLPDL